MGYPTPDVSIILPAFNEAMNIGRSIAKVNDVVKSLSSDYEIIVVDDGSRDGTSSEALRIGQAYPELEGIIKVVSYRPNQGKGFAIKKGFEGSKGNYIVFIDSDLDISPNHLSHYISSLKGADIVAASKFHPDSRVESPAIRKVLSICYHWLVRIFLQVDVSDTQAGLKAFRRSALERIMPALVVKQYAFDAEVFAVANICGLRIRELPVDIRMNASFPLKNIFKMFCDLLGIAYRKHITRSYHKMINHTYVEFIRE